MSEQESKCECDPCPVCLGSSEACGLSKCPLRGEQPCPKCTGRAAPTDTGGKCDHMNCMISGNFGDGFGTCSRCGGRVEYFKLPTGRAAPKADGEVRRYRVSYAHGVIEEDGSPRSPMDSRPMILASDHDAVCAQKDAAISALEKQRDSAIRARDGNMELYRRSVADIDELRTQLAAAQVEVEKMREVLGRALPIVEMMWARNPNVTGAVGRCYADIRTILSPATGDANDRRE